MGVAVAVLTCLVVGISDGDTLTVRCGTPGQYQQERVRISAIDAPERKQPFGARSKQSLSDLCYRVEARITSRQRDRYQRIVGDVQCNGTDAAQHQVAAGMAMVYDRYAKGYAHLYQFQAQARAAQLGIWSDPHVMAPWQWRKQQRSKQ